jgi:hypothetical protein
MAVSISGLRRNIKNVAHNYTDAQVCQKYRHHWSKRKNSFGQSEILPYGYLICVKQLSFQTTKEWIILKLFWPK